MSTLTINVATRGHEDVSATLQPAQDAHTTLAGVTYNAGLRVDRFNAIHLLAILYGNPRANHMVDTAERTTRGVAWGGNVRINAHLTSFANVARDLSTEAEQFTVTFGYTR